MSSSGRKERKLAETAAVMAREELGQLQQSVLEPFGQGTAAGQTLASGHEAAQALLGAIPGLVQPGGALPYGINAPGILEGLISRSREQSAHASQQAAQSMADLIPSQGGAAVRGVSDIYRRGASEQVALETGLRTQAAERSLTDRLSMLGGLTGALSGVAGGVGGMTQATLAPQALSAQVGMQRAGVLSQLMNMYSQMYSGESQQIGGMWSGLGQGLGQIGGAVLGAVL